MKDYAVSRVVFVLVVAVHAFKEPPRDSAGAIFGLLAALFFLLCAIYHKLPEK